MHVYDPFPVAVDSVVEVVHPWLSLKYVVEFCLFIYSRETIRDKDNGMEREELKNKAPT